MGASTARLILDTEIGEALRLASLRTISIADFLSMEIPARKNLLAPIIPEQGLVMAHGPRGLGKTHLSVGITVAVASGSRFLRWQAPEPAGVLHLDGEMPAVALQERFARAIEMSEKAPSASLRILTPDFNRESGMPNLGTTDGQAAVDALITPDTKLIVVDNLSSLLRTGVENDAESWLPLQTWALRHRAAGRSILFVHHSGKGGAQRGTSRREDVLDTVLGLKKPADYLPSQGARFEIHFEKARGFFGDQAHPFDAHLAADAEGKPAWTLRDLASDIDERIASMLTDGMRPNDVAADLGVHRATVFRHKKKLGL